MMKQKRLQDVLSPSLIFHALQDLEHGVLWVIGLSWVMALLMMMLAIYTLHLSLDAKRDVISVVSSAPHLPQLQRQTIDLTNNAEFLSQLQKRYPNIHFIGENTNLVVTSNDGAQFHEWLAALDYVDTFAPQWRWSLHEFCVGSCPGHDLMYAVVSAEDIVFSAP